MNCAAIPGTLLEATLFGHERGAFTGAFKSQPGKFLQAEGGTLFLDEIGDLPLELQAKLLRVLQERQVEPLGGKPVSIDIRVLAATHQDLDAAVRAGRFRQDLFFRLNGASLKLPALRERSEDISLLAESFLKATGTGVKISPEGTAALERHSWSGNIRELQQVVTRAALLCEGQMISAQDFELDSSGAVARDWAESSEFSSLQEAQLAFTREYVEKILSRFEGNRARAASNLGVSERTLYRILSTDSPGRLS